jgi:hypothetical protein
MIEGIRIVCPGFVLCALLSGCGRHTGSSDGPAPATAVGSGPRPVRVVAATAGETKPVFDAPGFYVGKAGLTPSERAGREIWHEATAGHARFHTHVQQRVNVLIARDRDGRLKPWGLINDPGCRMSGAESSPARTLDEFYG